MNIKKILTDSFKVGLNAVKPINIIKNKLPSPPKGRTYVIGAGKAAAPMAKELFKLIIDRDELRGKQSNFENINI